MGVSFVISCLIADGEFHKAHVFFLAIVPSEIGAEIGVGNVREKYVWLGVWEVHK